MNKRIFLLIVIATGILVTINTRAQQIDNLYISATTETSSFPFTRFLPIHPGVELGTTLLNKGKQNSEHFVNVYLGGYYHQKIENGFYLRSEYAFRYKINNTIGIDFPIGGGYQHSFFPGEIYEQNIETGDWERIKQRGKPHLFVDFGLGFTYLKSKRVQPFIRYESIIDFPLYNGFMTTRTFFKLGINIKISNDDETK